MWHTIWKGIWSHKRRLLGTSTAVMLGVAFLASALVLGDTMTKGFDGLFSEANAGTDVVVRNATEIGSGDVSIRGSLDASLQNELEQVDDVADIAPVVEGYGQIVGADGDNIGGGGPPTIATNWLGETPINPWRLDKGRPPRAGPAGQPYEVVIDRAAAEDGGLGIGDVTTVKVPEPVDVKIVGLVTFGGADSLGPTTYTGFAPDVANSLIGEPGEVSAFRIAAKDDVNADALRDDVARVLPDQARGPHRRPTDRRDDGRHPERLPRHVQDDHARLRRDRSGGRLVQHPQHVLHPHRPAHTRVGAAAGHRCLPASGPVVGDRRGDPRRRRRFRIGPRGGLRPGHRVEVDPRGCGHGSQRRRCRDGHRNDRRRRRRRCRRDAARQRRAGDPRITCGTAGSSSRVSRRLDGIVEEAGDPRCSGQRHRHRGRAHQHGQRGLARWARPASAR